MPQATADKPSETYGALKRSIHLAGYSFEQALSDLEWLLNKDRWRLVGDFGKDVNKFLDSIHLDHFRIVAERRKRIAQEIKRLTNNKASNRTIAGALGVSHTTIDDDGKNLPRQKKKAASNEQLFSLDGRNLPPEWGTGAEAGKAVRRKETKLAAAEQTRERREASRSAVPLADGMDLRIGDCRTKLDDIADDSVPLILTDPPYGDEAEPLYEWLAEWAAQKLIPGGSLICYTGQSRLDRDMRIMSMKLRYWWLLIMKHKLPQRLPGKFVMATFKPVLWYVKEHRRGRTLVADTLPDNPRDKDMHDWGQGAGGVWSLIEYLTEPEELIVDPFAGTAQWGQLVANMGRRWIGVDIERGGTETVAAEVVDEQA